MVIKCKSRLDAQRIITNIKERFPNSTFNFIINEIDSVIYLIVDGEINRLGKTFLDSISVNVVFSSLEKDFYFVNDKTRSCQMPIGNRIFHHGDRKVSVVAGPCEIESFSDLYTTATALKEIGVSIFRAMPRKPRTSPYNFQGVGDVGWEYLGRIKEELNMPVLAEVFSQEELDLAEKYHVDIIQIGSRNMQNYDLVKRAAKSHITTVLKKGMWCNNEQLLKAAEYFFVYGNGNVILAERGIQTHENGTRNTLDLSSILYLKERTNLPIMVDASHGTGVKNMVTPMNCAAVLIGADLIEVEVHIAPDKTIKPGDYYQMLDTEEYKEMIDRIYEILPVCRKTFDFTRSK